MNFEDLFEKERLQHVAKMREKYFSTGSFGGIEGIREEIMRSWKASYEAGIHISDTEKPVLSDEELLNAQKRSKELLKVAIPYMEKLRGFLKEDCFWITLLDDTGTVIKIVGADKAKKIAESTGLAEGSYRGSGVYYTGLFKMCGTYNKPVQIVSTEHSSSIDDDLAGAASPIVSKETGERIGIIGISGYWWETHAHTLGLTIMAAEAISQQLMLGNINHRLDIALESTNTGIMYIEKNGTILTLNKRAADMLSGGEKNKEDFIFDKFFNYIGNKGISSEYQDVAKKIMQEVDYVGEYKCVIKTKGGGNTIHCSVKKPKKGSDANYIVQMYPRSEINKLVADTSLMSATFTFDDIIGECNTIRMIKEQAQIAAKYSNTTLILGESGTGKELFAQAIHNCSKYAKGSFVAVNCGAIPKALLESELFGYEAGSFTGAQKNGKQGKFEIANGGTLFLDEIGDMPYEMQVSLLRALQTKSFVRVGGKQPINVDIMIIAATNKNIEKQIAEGTFREDLYYRLNVFTLQIPPLRSRPGDVKLLAEYFFEKKCNSIEKKLNIISPEVMDMLMNYEWPGNVRELENAIERAVLLCKTNELTISDLPDKITYEYSGRIKENPISPELISKQDGINCDESQLVQMLLECEGNVSEVARRLGKSRPTIYRHLKKEGIYQKMRKIKIEN